MTWRDDARCRGMDPTMFDIDAEGNTGIHGLRICTGIHPTGDSIGECPVRQPCLTEALGLVSGDDYGVLGGTTADARTDVRTGRLSADRAMARGNGQASKFTRDENLRLRDERAALQAAERFRKGAA